MTRRVFAFPAVVEIEADDVGQALDMLDHARAAARVLCPTAWNGLTLVRMTPDDLAAFLEEEPAIPTHELPGDGPDLRPVLKSAAVCGWINRDGVHLAPREYSRDEAGEASDPAREDKP